VAINKRAHIFHQFILSTPPTLEELEDFGRMYLAPVARSGEAISFLTYLNDSSTTEIEDDAMKGRALKFEEYSDQLPKSSTEKTPGQIKMAKAKAKKAKERSSNRPFSIKEAAAWTALNFKDIETEEVSATMNVAARHVSMDSPLSDGEESTLIDVLVNNAGYGSYGALEDVPITEAKHQFDVNIFGLARLTQLVLPHMRSQKSGRIINISSIG